MQGSCDRQGYPLANKVTYLCGAPDSFWPISFDPEVRRHRPDLEFWPRVVKSKKRLSTRIIWKCRGSSGKGAGGV
jgi:hypothetical protein